MGNLRRCPGYMSPPPTTASSTSTMGQRPCACVQKPSERTQPKLLLAESLRSGTEHSRCMMQSMAAI